MAEENLKQFKDDICNHFDVVAEDIKDKIGTISEQVATNTEKLEEHDKRFDKIDNDLATIKLDIEFIKNELKQKVSRDEFVALEKRVSMMEIKLNKIS
jgi:peptidoglycan hydrolase CwlO-like protein